MRARNILYEKLLRHVSLRYAPAFRQPEPHEVIGVPTKLIPSDYVPAFVLPEVISEPEERALLALSEPWFSRIPYNDGHVDSLIHHYKEFYRSYGKLVDDVLPVEGGQCCDTLDKEVVQLTSRALKRCWRLASEYTTNIPLDDRVHFLRLNSNGFIRAHVDDSRNSSGIIAGLSLGTARVMTLTHPKHPGQRVELMLAPRALYILIGTARYEWEHSTDWEEDDKEHIERVRSNVVTEGIPLRFDGNETHFTRGVRTAVIFRGISPMALLRHKVQGKKSLGGQGLF